MGSFKQGALQKIYYLTFIQMEKIKKLIEKYSIIKVAKEHGRTEDQQKYRKDLAKTLKELRSSEDIWKDWLYAMLKKEMMTEEYISSLWKDRFFWKDVAMELIESWKWELVVKYLDKFRWLDHKDLAQTLIDRWEWKIVTDYLDNFDWAESQLQPYLCHAYDIYLKTQKRWEHCPLVEIWGYVFAALWFTCGHVDAVKVFNKKWKPQKTTKDAVNTLIKAWGVMELI